MHSLSRLPATCQDQMFFALNALSVTMNSYKLKFKNEKELKHCINTCCKYLLKIPAELT